MKLQEAEKIVESLIFAAEHPLTPAEISEIVKLDEAAVVSLVDGIRKRYLDGALMIRNVGGGYQVVTKPEFMPWLEKLGRPTINAPLSMAATETIAIIAYEQPVTKAEIEQIRGVRSDSSVNSLLERGLICELGRKKGPGRPILYGVTEEFFSYFGLRSLDELPLRGITDWK